MYYSIQFALYCADEFYIRLECKKLKNKIWMCVSEFHLLRIYMMREGKTMKKEK